MPLSIAVLHSPPFLGNLFSCRARPMPARKSCVRECWYLRVQLLLEHHVRPISSVAAFCNIGLGSKRIHCRCYYVPMLREKYNRLGVILDCSLIVAFLIRLITFYFPEYSRVFIVLHFWNLFLLLLVLVLVRFPS